MKEFQKRIGYAFKNTDLLYQALSHSSFSNDCKNHNKSNERLEFLGDSVLSIIVAKHLFETYTDIPEGKLTKLRASLVCEKALFEFAKKIDLGDVLFIGKGEEATGGRERPSILADAFEAVIAAIFLDGGMVEATKFVMQFIPKKIDTNNIAVLNDYKTALQEIVQQNKEEKIEYHLVEESGPDHNKKFTVQVNLNSNVIGQGVGKSKKQAEQNAAKEALELMGYETL